MYSIIVSPRAQKDLKRLKSIYRIGISSALKEIKEDPYVGKPLTRELTGRFSYKIGVYRIIYKINNQDKLIYIFTAGHRSTVYKLL